MQQDNKALHGGPVRLPVPLNALRAFEAAARHLSVKGAAAEIGVTPSAVSHQIRLLEDSLGVELLRRTGARLELTQAGRTLTPGLSAGFRQIAESVGGLQTGRKLGPLRLSLPPGFAAHWLLPRLAAYPAARPGFELELQTTQEVADLAAGSADAAVRHGKGHWTGTVSEHLFDETLTLLGQGTAGEDARALVSRSTLFISGHRHEGFARWNASLPGGPVQPAAIITVDSTSLSLKAALDGTGITFAGPELAAEDIAAGRLSLIFAHRVAAEAGYYLCHPPALERDRRIRNLRTWLLAETGDLRRAG
ncbi:LysR substrate-binding domain-containing protein [Pannonibacter phragmitetus]|uniref:LysR substrate-binding domain-containing protein n=1 Tax=Pannonibacter phragmitetus TaxID=121719 RepID=UPI000B9666AD|nr:LysR substrate-binding domain-containing protein [Pannonibacter phragmitetus]